MVCPNDFWMNWRGYSRGALAAQGHLEGPGASSRECKPLSTSSWAPGMRGREVEANSKLDTSANSRQRAQETSSQLSTDGKRLLSYPGSLLCRHQATPRLPQRSRSLRSFHCLLPLYNFYFPNPTLSPTLRCQKSSTTPSPEPVLRPYIPTSHRQG